MHGVPVLLRILKNVEETLRGITPGAGFETNVQGVYSYRGDGANLPVPNLSYYLVGESPGESLVGFEDRWLDVIIEGVFRPTDLRHLDEEAIGFQVDIYNAMIADITRGGVARQTTLGTVIRGRLPADLAIVQMHWHINFCHPLNDPSIFV